VAVVCRDEIQYDWDSEVRQNSGKVIQTEHYYIVNVLGADILALGAAGGVSEEHDHRHHVQYDCQGKGKYHQVGLLVSYPYVFVLTTQQVHFYFVILMRATL